MKRLSIFAVIILTVCYESQVYAQSGLDGKVANLSEQIAKEMADNQKKTIAVIEFVDLKGNVSDFGRYLAEKLITKLYQTKKFKVIERQLLNRVIAEQKLNLTGTIDPSSAKQLGKLLGVDAICSGTVSDLAQSLDVNGRLISTETGEIFAVASVEITKDDSVKQLLGVNAQNAVGPAGSGQPLPSSSPITRPIRVIAKDFVFELDSCKFSDGSVTCRLTIMNDTAEDRTITLCARYAYGYPDCQGSRVFDRAGNEYFASKAQLGSQMDSTLVSGRLIPNVPSRAMLRFDGFSPDAKSVKLLRVSCIHFVESFSADFRDVSITK